MGSLVRPVMAGWPGGCSGVLLDIIGGTSKCHRPSQVCAFYGDKNSQIITEGVRPIRRIGAMGAAMQWLNPKAWVAAVAGMPHPPKIIAFPC